MTLVQKIAPHFFNEQLRFYKIPGWVLIWEQGKDEEKMVSTWVWDRICLQRAPSLRRSIGCDDTELVV